MPATERVLEAEERYINALDVLSKDESEWTAPEANLVTEFRRELWQMYDLDGIATDERMIVAP